MLQCGNVSLTDSVGYDRLLFHERHVLSWKKRHKNKTHWSTFPLAATLLQLVRSVPFPLVCFFWSGLFRHTHTHTHTTHTIELLWKRTLLDNRQHSQEATTEQAGFKPRISAGGWPQTHASDRAATKIGPSFCTFLYLTRDTFM